LRFIPTEYDPDSESGKVAVSGVCKGTFVAVGGTVVGVAVSFSIVADVVELIAVTLGNVSIAELQANSRKDRTPVIAKPFITCMFLSLVE
jgi:hypothetical protein